MLALPQDDGTAPSGGDREQGVRVIDLDAVRELGAGIEEELMDAVAFEESSMTSPKASTPSGVVKARTLIARVPP